MYYRRDTNFVCMFNTPFDVSPKYDKHTDCRACSNRFCNITLRLFEATSCFETFRVWNQVQILSAVPRGLVNNTGSIP